MHLDIHDALTKKIGPLPGAAWAGIALVGVLAYVHFHKASSPGSSTAATTTDPGTTALDASGGLLGGGGGGGGGSDGGASTGTLSDPTPVFVPVPDPGSTQFPDSGTTQPVDGGSSGGSTGDAPPGGDLIPPASSPQTQTLNVSSAGTIIGTVQAPILPIGAPASELYAAVGLKPSDPYTLLPPSEPQNATQQMEQAQGEAERQALATASKTHVPVAV